MSLPSFYFLLALAAVIPSGISPVLTFFMIVAIMSFISWAGFARIIRGMAASVRSRPYVEAARALGASRTRVIFLHVIPSVLGYAIVAATLSIPGFILGESALSLLGLGIQEPAASWGNLLAQAQDRAESRALSVDSHPRHLHFPDRDVFQLSRRPSARPPRPRQPGLGGEVDSGPRSLIHGNSFVRGERRGASAGRTKMAGCCGGDDRRGDDRARRVDRQRFAALHAEKFRRRRPSDHLGGHELPGRGQRDDSDDRMVRGALRAQTLFPRFGVDVRGHFGDVRACRRRPPDGGLPRAPGRGGRRDDSALAGDPASKPFRPTSTRLR